MGGHGDSGARLRVTLLGAFSVVRGEDAVPVPGSRLRGLLVRLALGGGRVVGPGALADALWPEDRPADTANALQSLVSRLRRVLGAAGAVAQADGGYRLEVSGDDVDALRFERLAAAGGERLRGGDPAAAATILREAMSLWPGPAGAEPELVAAVAPTAATQLAHASAEAAADLAEAALILGHAAEAQAGLTVLLAEMPAHERAAALLMDALAAQGRQAEALGVYERIRETLADQLGADPGSTLRDRHLRLLRLPAETAAPAPIPGDLDQLPPSNLPAPLTSFIGRDDDLGRIDTLFAGGRLVTVVGPGGAGKTRLAVEAARRHRHEHRDGTWLADLSSVTEPAKVAAAVLAAIGLRGGALFESSSKMRFEGDEIDMLAEQLGASECLLVVDNCEHVIDAAAQLVGTLLPRCGRLRVLATSREPLAIDGEALVPLGPLTLPGPEADVAELRRTSSVRLFTERAAAVRPGFDVDERTAADVVRVVCGLDGMPLALELAAARLRTLSLSELVAGLSDRFRLLGTGNRTASARHRTLRAVITWSWDLLGADERIVADRVSVLPGGVTPSSAVAVCAGTPVSPSDVPELLAALVDRSMLQLAADGRYRMLETLREYGIGRLDEQGRLDEVRGLAAGHLSRLVAHYDPMLRNRDQLVALGVLRAEYDNALAALRHLCDAGDDRGAVRLALGLAWYWQMFGRQSDAVYWLGETLALPASRNLVERDLARAVLLLNTISSENRGVAEGVRSHTDDLRTIADRMLGLPSLPGLAGVLTGLMFFFLDERETALTILGRIVDGPDVWLAGMARVFRGQAAENEGDLEQMRVDVAGALECFREAGDRWGLATVLPMRALLRQYDEDLDGALADLSEARTRAREFGSLGLNDEIFIDLRWVDLHIRRGEIEQAFALIATARTRAVRTATPELAVLIDALEAGMWVRLGEVERAAAAVEAAEAGVGRGVAFVGDHGGAIIGSVRAWLCVQQGDGPGAEAALAGAYASALQTHDMPILSMVAVTAAGLAEMYGRPRDVAFLLGAAARLRGAHDRTDQQVQMLAGRSRAALSQVAFDEAYAKGWELDGGTASREVDPARLHRAELPSGPPGVSAQGQRHEDHQ